jgi:hypothetical protein
MAELRNTKVVVFANLFGVLLLVLFAWLAEVDQISLHNLTLEDGPIESMSAILFGVSSICFFVAAFRSDFLKQKKEFPRYFMIIAWAVLMFIFMGEEISWGQRIFGFETLESLAKINKQNEFNFHNIAVVDTFLGGKFRALSLMMFLTGLIFPLIVLFKKGRRFFQKMAFPVAPLCYWSIFVGAYFYAKHYFPMIGNDSAEVREFLMSIGMVCFSLHGAIDPKEIFRAAS